MILYSLRFVIDSFLTLIMYKFFAWDKYPELKDFELKGDEKELENLVNAEGELVYGSIN